MSLPDAENSSRVYLHREDLQSSDFVPTHCSECGEKLGSKHVDGKERLYCSECDQVEWLNPDIAAGFVVQRGDEILLQKRGIEPNAGKWSIPAGYLELEESPVEGARRELKEETGLNAGEENFLGHVTLEHPNGRRVVVAVYHVDFEDVSGEMSREEEEVEELRFWKIEEVIENSEILDFRDYLDVLEKIR